MQTVTEALKVMLAEDDKMLETFKDKVDFLGQFLVEDGQMEAARFMLILRGMLDHEVIAQHAPRYSLQLESRISVIRMRSQIPSPNLVVDKFTSFLILQMALVVHM